MDVCVWWEGVFAVTSEDVEGGAGQEVVVCVEGDVRTAFAFAGVGYAAV